MRLIREIRARRARRAFESVGRLYSGLYGPDDVRWLQLGRLNEIWQQIREKSPFYASLVGESKVPRQFDSWRDFSSTVPIISRAQLKKNLDQISLSGARPEYWRMTGGTSAEPLQLPAWRREDRATSPSMWLARSWFGAGAADRLFLLWGHNHLFGRGLRGHVNAFKRGLKDRGLGYLRFSAYDLSEEALREAGRRLLRFRPGYVLGYSTALHRLALFNQDRRSLFHGLNLKVAIATGESFPSDGSARLISSVLGCPVAMEYGAVETGIVAHQRPSGEFHVFWGNYYVEGLPSSEYPGASELLVTSLYPRMTPLLRYRIGDLVSASAENHDIGTTFGKVIGRCNDGIHLDDDGFVHSESFSHVLRDIPEVDAFQVRQSAARDITIAYVSENPLPETTECLLRDRLQKVDPRLCAASFQKVPVLSRTVAGKARRIISEVSTSS